MGGSAESARMRSACPSGAPARSLPRAPLGLSRRGERLRRKCQFALAGPGGHHHRRGVAGDPAPGTCLASLSDQGMSQLDILRSELELAKKTMSLLEEGLESIAQEQAESEEEKVESPATTSAADEGESVDLVRVESLELEVERLRVEALRVEVLEEKIAALELSASSREKELLLIIEEKERRLTSMDQIIADQETFVAEMRSMEIREATDASLVYDSRVIDLESHLMDAQATVAEVMAEKERLERKVGALLEEQKSAAEASDSRDALLPSPSAAAPQETSAENLEKLEAQSEVIRSLQAQVKAQETAMAQATNRDLDLDLEASMREERLNHYVAKIRQLEIEMAQMASIEESDQIVREVMDYKMTIQELREELKTAQAQGPPAATAPAATKAVDPPKAGVVAPAPAKRNGHETFKNGVFKRSLQGTFVLRKKKFVPKQMPTPATNGKTPSASTAKDIGSTFTLKKKEFVPKDWPRPEQKLSGTTESLEDVLNEKLNRHVAKIRELEIQMSAMATVQESDALARELTEARMTIHQLQMELELVRLSALDPTPASSSAPSVPAPAQKAKPKKAEVGGAFQRAPKGSFELKKKVFASKPLPQRSGYQLRKKIFAPKQWPRGAAFSRSALAAKGSYSLRKKVFASNSCRSGEDTN